MQNNGNNEERYQSNLKAERDSAALYRVLAETEDRSQIAEVYRRLAAVEEKHARFWEERLKEMGKPVPTWKLGTRMRLLRWIARRMGPGVVASLIAAAERREKGMYDNQPETDKTGMRQDERSHTRVMNEIVKLDRGGGVEGGVLARLEGRHRSIGGNALRAAVLGANDGLVSNLSLVMGVAGADLSSNSILVTGFAGLLAGACSMAIGEWISVQSSRELNERQIQVESDELEAAPEEEMEELALIYEAKGLPKEEAVTLASRLITDKRKALDTLAREELGIDPSNLGGSAWTAAGTSFGLFSIGAVIPVIPFLFFQGPQAIWASLVLSGAGLFALGTGITLVTGLPVLKSGLRQLAFGLAAAAITFGIGRLIGVSLG